ncbi:MAG: trypsin-like peptidase domain-containing protein, partial [Candidatus Nanohaloarchaea archaeon]|nr:trypsin-like peptidase domain-containing protein [Candidatus Nanohaloarchaea archaeon]
GPHPFFLRYFKLVDKRLGMEERTSYEIIATLLVGVGIGILLMQPSTFLDSGPVQVQEPSIGSGQKKVVVKTNASTPLPEIFEMAKHSVVSVQTEGPNGGAQGSGFVYSSEGYIVTNEHVVQGATEVEVTFLSGKQRQAKIVGADPYTDLAVLKVDPEGLDLQPLSLGEIGEVRVGDRVAAIGNPFGLSGSMTSGIVSQKNRLLRTEGQFSIPNVLQTDAAINPGNSGGPLLNMQGEVIGVNTAISSKTGTFNGVGFAVSVETVKRVVPVLIQKGEYRHPWIGVSGRDVSPEIANAMDLNVSYGFLVVEVVDDSPADRAGLHAGGREVTIEGRKITVGGDVIVGIDGRKVRKINDILNYLAKETSVGETITLTVLRDGERKEIELTLARRPQPSG